MQDSNTVAAQSRGNSRPATREGGGGGRESATAEEQSTAAEVVSKSLQNATERVEVEEGLAKADTATDSPERVGAGAEGEAESRPASSKPEEAGQEEKQQQQSQQEEAECMVVPEVAIKLTTSTASSVPEPTTQDGGSEEEEEFKPALDASNDDAPEEDQGRSSPDAAEPVDGEAAEAEDN